MHRIELRRAALRFAHDTRGNVALLLGLLAVPLVSAVGLSVDYARAVAYQNRLEATANAATLAGLDAMRTMLAADPNVSVSKVKASAEETTQKFFLARKPPEVNVVIQSATVARDGDTVTAKIAYAATAPTYFAGLLNKPTMEVGGSASATGPTAAGATQPAGDPNVVFEDYFKVVQSQSGSWSVTKSYNDWRLPSDGLEMNPPETYGTVPSPVGGGGMLVELDGSKNGAMARKIYLTAGQYDLRWYMKDRVSYPAYNPVQICGINPGEYNWATAEGYMGTRVFAPQSNTIGVYLEPVTSDDPPEVFPAKPNDSSLIDMCISTGGRWIERRVRFVVNTPAFFWLAFQAEGPSDGFGGLLSGMKLCRQSCSGPTGVVREIFPWTANQLLFEDSFNTPTPKGVGLNTTLDNSGVGTGWTTPPASGWTTTPVNQVDHQVFKLNGVDVMGVDLDAGYRDGLAQQPDEPTANRSVHRRFLLAPGLYQLSFLYTSGAADSTTISGVYCGLEQEAAHLAAVGTATSRLRVYMDEMMTHSYPTHARQLGALPTWIDGNGGEANSPRIGENVVHSCVYASAPTEQRVYLRVVKSAYYWLTLAAEDDAPASDQRGPIVSRLQLRAVGGRSQPDPAGYVSVPVQYRGRMLNTVRNGYYVSVTTQ